MPIFQRGDGSTVEVIRARPKPEAMPEGTRRRIARDKAMELLATRHKWRPEALALAFGLSARQVRNRLKAWEQWRASQTATE